MAEIKCPMCGKPNPSDLDVCQFCEARLKPLTDELSRSQPPLHPGEDPTVQDTGELEPILPQWLREVRQQARESAEGMGEQESAEEEASEAGEPDDLLAGLQSQAEEKEEIPDWLAGLRGASVQSSTEESSTEDDDLSALRSMLGEDAPELIEPAESASTEEETSALPGWISDLGAGETEEPTASSSDFEWSADFGAGTGSLEEPSSSAAGADSDLPDWLKDPKSEAGGEAENDLSAWSLPAEPAQSISDMEGEELSSPAELETPDWLASLEEQSAKPASTEPAQPIDEGNLPDWLSSLGEESGDETPQEPAQPATKGETPDWLASLGGESLEETPQEPVQPSAEGETPDWLASLGEESTEETPQERAQPASERETPDWLASLGEESAGETPQEPALPEDEGETPAWLTSLGEKSTEETTQEPIQPAAEGETPDWLASLEQESSEETPQESAQPELEGDLPDWLSSLGEESAETREVKSTPAEPHVEPEQPAEEAETPDWLASLEESTAEPGQPASTPAFTTDEDELVEDVSTGPAFVDGEGSPLETEDVDAIFSMDMPDWLSEAEAADQETGEALIPAADDDLRPADLPDWVQAMRPVESVISETEGVLQEDQPVEEKGPLAGLRGVLPAMPGVGPSSKPKAYAIKLQASEEQQSSAAMLEQMLASEINPEPIITQKVVGTQRFLRWIIAVLLLLVVGGTVFTGTQMNPMPVGAPPETSAAIRYIQEGLPADAPVLMIFDYEAALSGELEATAAPFVDHMLLLKHPRLTFVSSTSTGAGLAERFMRDTQSDHNYQDGGQLANLGYLPGGAAGVLAFAENPASVKPLTVTGIDAWETPALQGVERLSDFSAIILLTNDVETARIWIEQTETFRGEARFLVISSAQSGPMILPYVQTGQVDGMVTGLDGSAPIEQVNSGRPGIVRRYWDAYGLGLLTALALIAVGSLWSLFAGWQARRRERGEA